MNSIPSAVSILIKSRIQGVQIFPDDLESGLRSVANVRSKEKEQKNSWKGFAIFQILSLLLFLFYYSFSLFYHFFLFNFIVLFFFLIFTRILSNANTKQFSSSSHCIPGPFALFPPPSTSSSHSSVPNFRREFGRNFCISKIFNLTHPKLFGIATMPLYYTVTRKCIPCFFVSPEP